MVPLYVEKVGKKVRVMPCEKEASNIAVFEHEGSQGAKQYR